MTIEPSPPSPFRAWRQRCGWTQDQAAKEIGISQGVLSGIERGENTTLETIRRIVAVYGVSEEEAGAVLVGGAS